MSQCCGSVLTGLSTHRIMEYPKTLAFSALKELVDCLIRPAAYLHIDCEKTRPPLVRVKAFMLMSQRQNDPEMSTENSSGENNDQMSNTEERLNVNQMSNTEERLISTMSQGVSGKQTSDILTETMPQGVAWKQTSDMSTENSLGPNTTTHINDFTVNQTNKTEERFTSTTTQGVPGKQTLDMSTETMPQVLFGKQTLDTSNMSTESSLGTTESISGGSTVCVPECENNLTAAQTKAFIVNQMNKTESQLASIMPQEVLGKQTFESLLQTLPSADLDQNRKLIMNRQDTNKFLNSVLFNGMLHLRLME